jgi:hypothetical protein
MAYSIIQGQEGFIDPVTAAIDTGWTVDGVNAFHTPCNPGTMIALTDFGLVVGRQYVFSYKVFQWTSGQVYIIAGTQNGTSRTAVGSYTETLTMTGNNTLSFYSDGSLGINSLSFYDLLLGPQSGRTITFNEKENKWVQEWGWYPELMVKFLDKLFTFQNGVLWLHNSNSVMNNFFGQQYSAQVVFIPNQEYETNKLWYNMRFDSTGGWYVKDITIRPNDQFPNGMQTQMSKTNCKSIDGVLWADILRDMNDPNFHEIPDAQLRKAVAMFQGRMMQGGYMIVTLQNDDNTPATLASVETYYIDVKKAL